MITVRTPFSRSGPWNWLRKQVHTQTAEDTQVVTQQHRLAMILMRHGYVHTERKNGILRVSSHQIPVMRGPGLNDCSISL